MIEKQVIEWGENHSLRNQLQQSKKTYDMEMYGEVTAFQWIEHLITSTKNVIEFHKKNKKDFNEKEIGELKYLNKMCDKYFNKESLGLFFLESYAKAKNTHIVMTQNINFGEVIQESIFANIDAQIKSIERGRDYRMDKKRNDLIKECENEIKEILQQEGIKDFAVKAQELISFNFS